MKRVIMMAINIDQLVEVTVNELQTQLLASPDISEQEIRNIAKSCYLHAFYQTDNAQEQARLWRRLGAKVHPDKLKSGALYDYLAPGNVNILQQVLNDFRSEEQLVNREETLKIILKQVNSITLKTGNQGLSFETIKLPYEIDERQLNPLINLLEKQNTPIALLTCGLLLEGRIPNHCADEKEDLSGYLEKRTHDAISFYVKAAQSNALKSTVGFLLWELNTITDFESVRMRLSEFELLPPTDFISQYSHFKAPTQTLNPSVLYKGSPLFFQFKNEKESAEEENLEISKKPK